MKLTIELVPESLWYINPRNAMGQAKWDKLRKEVYVQYGHVCAVCTRPGRLNCHEIWAYDDVNHVQSLQGFIALCDMCHHCKHIGYAGILASEGKLDFEKVIHHFMAVNDCTREVYEQAHTDAFTLWRERNKFTWSSNWGPYAQLMDKSS
jgi:hypothetical protein